MKKLHIVVIESGFIYIGYPDTFDCPILGRSMILKMAHNIERWGTTDGLGQLANVGKQPDTRLRFTGTITIPITKILHLIYVEEKAAESYGF